MKNLPKSLLAQVVGGRAEVTPTTGGTAGHPTTVEVLATAGALGGGIGASVAIEAAGSASALGATAVPVYGAAAAGVVAAGYVGYGVGTLINDSNFLYIADGTAAVFNYAGSLSQAASKYYEGIGALGCTYAPGTSPLEMEANYNNGQ